MAEKLSGAFAAHRKDENSLDIGAESPVLSFAVSLHRFPLPTRLPAVLPRVLNRKREWKAIMR